MTVTSSKKKLLDNPNDEQDDDCQQWAIKYNKSYEIFENLPEQEQEKKQWKKEILDILRNDKINLRSWEDFDLSSILDILNDKINSYVN